MTSERRSSVDDDDEFFQHEYGARPRSNWGAGELLAPWAEGDVVHIPGYSPAFTDGRIPHSWSKHPELSKPGDYIVVTALSIGEGDEWRFRVCPIVNGEVVREESSDRIHMIPGECNYSAGWTLVESADPQNVREWPAPTTSETDESSVA